MTKQKRPIFDDDESFVEDHLLSLFLLSFFGDQNEDIEDVKK
jgi:hypothetical protein